MLSYKLIGATIEEIFAAHLHLVHAGDEGDVVESLSAGPLASQPQSFSALIDARREGSIYANAHTPAYPRGEIRGRI